MGKPFMRKRLYTVLPIALGVVWIAIGLFANMRGSSSSAWPSVVGEVVSCDLETTFNPLAGGGAQSGVTRLGRNKKAKVRYRYTVDGTEYRSEGHHFGLFGTRTSLSGSRSYVEAMVQKNGYRPGSTVTVFYDPAKPSVAVLRTGSGTSIFSALLFGLVGIGGGLFGMFRD